MSRYVQGEDRNQISLEPMCLDDMIAEDNPVRALETIVDSMNIPQLGFTYSETKETGRKTCSSCTHTAILTASVPPER